MGTPAFFMMARDSILLPMARIADDGRPDERQSFLLHALGELRVLGEKAVAGMNRVGARLFRGGDDRFDVEIGLERRRRADAHGFVGLQHVEAPAVGFGVDGNDGKVELVAGADDAHRDLAAIGDQHLADASRAHGLPLSRHA